MIKIMNIEQDKIYFVAGDIVEVRHNIENKPKMFITDKITKSIKDKDGNIENVFLGLKCKWYDKNQVLHEAIFSTKDLKHV